MTTAPKGYRITYIGSVMERVRNWMQPDRMTCELDDCESWTKKDRSCGGRCWWPLYGNQFGLEGRRNTVAHRCCYYQPLGFEGEWYWPVPKEDEGGGWMPGSPEAVKMWLDAGLPEDFRLPGQ